MPLTAAEFLILAVLCDGDLHTSGIMQAVYRKADGGLVIRSSGLHAVLRQLTIRGLIDAVKKPSEIPGRTGQRTHFRITPAGRQLVQTEADARARMR